MVESGTQKGGGEGGIGMSSCNYTGRAKEVTSRDGFTST